MSPRRLARLGVVVGLFGLSCAEAPPPRPFYQPPPPPVRPVPLPQVLVTPDAEYRNAAPAAGPEVSFTPPKIEEAKLSNGVTVLLVERHDMPIVAVDVVVRRGAEVGGPGVGAFVGAMLSQGTRTRSAVQLSDAFRALGAEYSTSTHHDATVAYAQVLSPKLDGALELLADMVVNPTFPKQEVERERSKRVNAIAQERDQPQALLANAVSYVLYPAGHPYKFSLLGTEAAVKAITPEDLAAFHRANVTPDRATIVVAGDVEKSALLPRLEKAFGKWRGTAAPGKPPPAPPAPKADDAKIVIIDRPGATQSNVAVTEVGVPRKSDDFDAITVMNTILGGQFSSRLNLNLREKHAYTYGAGSGFDMRHGAGPFRAGGAIVRESTQPAIQEIFSELDRIRTEPVSDEELLDAKSYLVRKLPAQFETVQATAGALASLAIHGLPLDEYATASARIGAVTKADVRRVAEKYLQADALRVVIVGDADAVEPKLGSLGLGKIDVLPKRDAPAAAPPPAAAKDAPKK